MIQRAVALLCSIGVGTAYAGISPESPTITSTATQVTVTYPGAAVGKTASTARTATVAASTGITVIDAFAVTGGFATISGVAAQRVLGFPQVGAMAATAAAACASMAVPCAVGAAALLVGGAAFLEGYRVRQKNNTNRGTVAVAGPLQADAGSVAPMSMQWCATGYAFMSGGANMVHCGGSPLAAQTAFYNVYFGQVQAYSTSIGYGLVYRGTPAVDYAGWDSNSRQFYSGGGLVHTTFGTQSAGSSVNQVLAADPCPSYFDFFKGVVPAGSVPGRDGKCPTGVYTDTDVAGVQALVTARTPAQVAELNQALAAFNDWAAGSTACESCSAPATTLTGPATATASPPIVTTTVDATGTTVKTTTTTQPLTYPVSSPPTLGLPASAYIKIGDNSTVQSVLTPSSGGAPIVTTTTTSTSPESAAAAAAAAAASSVTQCDKFPDSAGCAKLGTATDVAWSPQNQTITMTPAAPWGSDNGACPTPQSLTLGGFAIPFDNTLMCQFFSGMRFAVLAVASIIAVMIFLGARGGAE